MCQMFYLKLMLMEKLTLAWFIKWRSLLWYDDQLLRQNCRNFRQNSIKFDFNVTRYSKCLEKANKFFKKINKRLSPTLTDAAHPLNLFFAYFFFPFSSKDWVGVFIMQIYCTIFSSSSLSSLAACRNLHDSPKIKDIINMYSKTSNSIHHKIEEKNCIYDIFYEF